jgi:hypothetical protein
MTIFALSGVCTEGFQSIERSFMITARVYPRHLSEAGGVIYCDNLGLLSWNEAYSVPGPKDSRGFMTELPSANRGMRISGG